MFENINWRAVWVTILTFIIFCCVISFLVSFPIIGLTVLSITILAIILYCIYIIVDEFV